MVVFDKAEELIDYTITITDNHKYFAKKRRFTFVDRMQNLAIDIYDNLLRTNEAPKKQIEQRRSFQLKALSDIKVLQFLVELSCSRGFIDERQLGIWSKKISDVKNLTAAWYKKTI
jgi:hypothetical protein